MRYNSPFHIQNSFNDRWFTCSSAIDFCGDAICEASRIAEKGYHEGNIRVIAGYLREVIQFHEGGGIQHSI